MPPTTRRPYLLLAPALLAIALLFVGGLVVGLVQSLGYLPFLGQTELTLDHYTELLTDRTFYVSLGLTLYVAILSTAVATLLAIGAALVLRRSFRGSRWVTLLFQVPLPVPHLVAAAGIAMLLTQSGLFARLIYAAGGLTQPSDFPALVFDRGYVGVMLVYVWKEVPFIGLVVLAILKSTGLAHEEAARTLGATSWQAFRYVLLPLILPGVISTSIIVFAFVFGSFEVPLLLGVRYPNVLPVSAYRAFVDPDLSSRPEAMALGMVITAIVIVLLALYRRLGRSALT